MERRAFEVEPAAQLGLARPGCPVGWCQVSMPPLPILLGMPRLRCVGCGMWAHPNICIGLAVLAKGGTL